MKLSDYEKMVFIFPEQLEKFNNGETIVASTERFTDDDLVMIVKNEEYGKESHGGTIVRIKKGGFGE
jgi:phosphoribosylpyrophosphate synthetase